MPSSACQYTCHQHCVPFVNLNCKSIQDDGAAVVSPVAPSAASPLLGHHGQQGSPPSSVFQAPARGRVEPSRSLGQLSARPGSAARLIPEAGVAPTSGGPPPASSAQLLHHPLQQEGALGQGQAVASVKHQQKHLSRSASDGFVTVSPGNYTASQTTPAQQHVSPSRQQHQHILSPSSSFTPLSTSPRRRQSEPSSSPAPRRPDTPPPPPGAVPLNPLEHAPTPPREDIGNDGLARGRVDGETITEAATVRLESVKFSYI